MATLTQAELAAIRQRSVNANVSLSTTPPTYAGDRHVFEFLRNGGSRDANVNGSVTAVKFSFTATTNTWLYRMIAHIRDTGDFDAEKYGNGVTLTSGLDVAVYEGDGSTVSLDLLDGESIKSNSDWQALCYDFNYNDIGTGDNTGSVRWTFSNSGAPLYFPAGYSIGVTVNDDLTGLVSHWFTVQGVSS